MEKGASLSQPSITCPECLDQVFSSIKAAIHSRYLQGAHQLWLKWVCVCCKRSFDLGWFDDLAAPAKRRHPDQDNDWEAKFLLLSIAKKECYPRHWSSGGSKWSRDDPATDR